MVTSRSEIASRYPVYGLPEIRIEVEFGRNRSMATGREPENLSRRLVECEFEYKDEFSGLYDEIEMMQESLWQQGDPWLAD